MLSQYSSLGPVGSSHRIVWMCLTILWNRFGLTIEVQLFDCIYWLYVFIYMKQNMTDLLIATMHIT